VKVIGLRPILLAESDNKGAGSVLSGSFAFLRKGVDGDSGLRKQTIELYDELRMSLFGYLSCLGLKPQAAEDIIQETFLKLFHSLAGGMKNDNLRGWIFRVAHNLTMNLHKNTNRLLSSEAEEMATLLESRRDPALNPEEIVLKKEQRKRIVSAISRLTTQQRQCLHLRAEGLRYREIAVVLGVSTQRVADIVQTALAHLAGEL
jgi:RNA polymerase sigma-70 factor (ECF subfamily)